MLNTKQQEYVDHAKKMFGNTTLPVAELKKANSKFGCKYAPEWLLKNIDYKLGKLDTNNNKRLNHNLIKRSVP